MTPQFQKLPINQFHYLNPEEWRQAGDYFNYNQYSMFYLDTAPRAKHLPTIVCLHGFPTSSWDWRSVIDSFSSSHRIIAMDFLGFGFSDKPHHHAYTIQEQTNILEALLEYLGINGFHLLAHDYGDSVAQELLARCNQRTHLHAEILSCCFLNGGLFPESHHPRLPQRILASPFGGGVSLFANGTLFKSNLKRVFYLGNVLSKQELDSYWSISQFNNGHRIFHRLTHYMLDRKIYRKRWLNALIETRAPLMLMFGNNDPISGANVVSRYLELVGKGSVVSLDHAGHYPQLECSNKVVKYYQGFLDGFSYHEVVAS